MKYSMISIIIPCYNSGRNIESLLRRLKKQPIHDLRCEIIVVDDKSTDNTKQILQKQTGITTIFHSRNMGKGSAVSSGMKKATGDIFYIQDDDLEYLPKDIPKIVKPILSERADVVFGSRHLNHKNSYSSRLYYLGGLVIDWLINAYLGTDISDALTGAKAMNKLAYRAISPIESKGFEIETEITAKAARHNLRLSEVPISYNPRTHKQGKNIRWHHAAVILLALRRFA